MHGQELLHDIGLSIIAASVLAYLLHLLRQPLLLAYIVAGYLIGPRGFRWVTGEESIAALSELGLAFLLFIVGLEIDLKKLLQTGKKASLLGTAQVVACGAIGWLTAYALGYRGLEAHYLGVAFAFSSTMIVIKLLVDKGELDTIAGQATLGVLLIQDVLAIVVLAIQPNVTDPAVLPLALSILKGLGLAVGAVLTARYLLSPLFRIAAGIPEVILISAMAWCFLISGLAMKADFSIAMGALIAGVSLSTFPYNLDVIAKIQSLRDFFVTLFFVALGMQITLSSPKLLAVAFLLSLVAFGSRIVSVMPAARFLKYGNRVGFLTALYLVPLSEFSLVIVSLGLNQYKHVGQDIASLTIISLILTATMTTYLSAWAHPLAKWVNVRLRAVGIRDHVYEEASQTAIHRKDVVILGCHRVASSLISEIVGTRKDFVVVDFNPDVHRRLQEMRAPAIYADLSHQESLHHAGVSHAKIVLSTIPDDFLRGTDNLRILRQIKTMNPEALVITTAEHADQARAHYEAGAAYVFLPRILTARHLADVLQKIEEENLDLVRKEAMAALEGRTEVVP